MTGASEAEYLAATALVSRLVNFPDGTARILTFKNHYWRALDRFNREGLREDLSPEMGVPKGALQLTHEMCEHPSGTPEYEQRLRRSFEIFLRQLAYTPHKHVRAAVANCG